MKKEEKDKKKVLQNLSDQEIINKIKQVANLKNVNEKYIENLQKAGIHPCYSEKAHFNIGRIHLPVAPKCNIQCKYCKRGINKAVFRPGVTSAILKPKEALKFLEESLEKVFTLQIVGFAGPGEPLANNQTFETLRLVKDRFPDLNLCLATNGLALPEHIDELAKVDVSNITITINFMDPKKFSQIYEYIFFEGTKYTGEEAGKIIKQNQLKGIELAKERGILTRINTVFIPDINNDQIEDISRETHKRGAVLHNIMPLIPIYQFKNHRIPKKKEMHDARIISQKYMPQFRLCKQCRADAVGIPGIERAKLLEGKECTFVRFHG